MNFTLLPMQVRANWSTACDRQTARAREKQTETGIIHPFSAVQVGTIHLPSVSCACCSVDRRSSRRRFGSILFASVGEGRQQALLRMERAQQNCWLSRTWKTQGSLSHQSTLNAQNAAVIETVFRSSISLGRHNFPYVGCHSHGSNQRRGFRQLGTATHHYLRRDNSSYTAQPPEDGRT